MLYVVIADLMYQKPGGGKDPIEVIPSILPPEREEQVNKVWSAYAAAGRPFVFSMNVDD
jgi:hypothetical protein